MDALVEGQWERVTWMVQPEKRDWLMTFFRETCRLFEAIEPNPRHDATIYAELYLLVYESQQRKLSAKVHDAILRQKMLEVLRPMYRDKVKAL